MEGLIYWYILVITGIFLSACSQLLLKKSADKTYKSWISSMLNWRVITAYAVLFGSLFINVTAMRKGVNLKDLPILESLGYVFVPLLSLVLLKEKIEKRTIVAMILIIAGIILFYM